MSQIKIIVQELNEQLKTEEKFRLDAIYETPVVENGKKPLCFLGYANSIQDDFSIIPTNYTNNCNVEMKIRIKNIVNWINNHLFGSMLLQLAKKRNPLYTTEVVRMRIATNLILKLDLPKTKKLEWVEHLQTLYKKRKSVIDNYYEHNICKLPF